MRILVVGSFFPFPPNDGGRIAVYYPLRELAKRGHEITYACLAEEIKSDDLESMRQWCRVIVVTHDKHLSVGGVLRSLPSPYPYVVSRFHSQRLVDEILGQREGGWDMVQVEGLHSAYNGLQIRKDLRAPLLLRLHNIESRLLDRYRLDQSLGPKRLILWEESRKLKRWEDTCIPQFDWVIPISPLDADAIRGRYPSVQLRTIQSGVDVGRPFLRDVAEEQDSILWMGALNWPPNQDSLKWFVHEVFPSVLRKNPRATLYIAGSTPPSRFHLEKQPGIRFVGFVEDTRTILQRCPVAIVPLRSGGGIRLKILEMLAMKRGVVSTNIGCEGLAVKDGVNIAIADSAEAFASKVVQLLEDATLRRQFGEAGRALVCERYSWERIGDELDDFYANVVKKNPSVH